MEIYNADVVRTYADIAWWRDRFLNEGGPQTLIIVGPSGTGKSRMFRDHLPPDALYLGGTLSAYHFYCELYEYVDELIVVDDVDALFKDQSAVSLLKCLCNTDTSRSVFWGKRNKQLEDEGIPTRFLTTSRVCILANTLTSVRENLAAVLDRAFVLRFEPDLQELHAEVGHWCKDSEVYEFVGRHLNLVVQPSMRTYGHAENIKAMGGDWRGWLTRKWFADKPKLAMVAQIMADQSLVTANQRVARFAALGGGSKATYMRIQAKLREIMVTEKKAA
jgi:hypothetical protein